MCTRVCLCLYMATVNMSMFREIDVHPTRVFHNKLQGVSTRDFKNKKENTNIHRVPDQN